MISREKCLEWAQDNLVKCEFTEFGWQECYQYEFDTDELEALINRAYQEAIKDAARILEIEAERLADDGTYEDDVEYLKKLAGSIRNLGNCLEIEE